MMGYSNNSVTGEKCQPAGVVYCQTLCSASIARALGSGAQLQLDKACQYFLLTIWSLTSERRPDSSWSWNLNYSHSRQYWRQEFFIFAINYPSLAIKFVIIFWEIQPLLKINQDNGITLIVGMEVVSSWASHYSSPVLVGGEGSLPPSPTQTGIFITLCRGHWDGHIGLGEVSSCQKIKKLEREGMMFLCFIFVLAESQAGCNNMSQPRPGQCQIWQPPDISWHLIR